MTSRAQYRLNNPLVTKEFSVNPGERVQVRIAAFSNNGATSPRALLCRIFFLNENSEIVPGDYEGAFSSATYGQFIYIASTVAPKRGSWSKRLITAPSHSKKIRLVVIEGEARINDLEEIKDIECITVSPPLLESVLPIAEQFPTKLTLRFTEKVVTKDTVLLAVSYLDEASQEIGGPYASFAFSSRYGYFKYIHRTFLSNIYEIILLAPARTRFVRIRVHPLKETNTIDCVGSPKLEVYSPFKKIINDSDWRRIQDNEILELPLPDNNETIRLCELEVSYLAFSNGQLGFDIEFLCTEKKILENLAQRSETFQSLPSTGKTVDSNVVTFQVPGQARYIRLNFRVCQNCVLYINSNIILKKVSEEFSSEYVIPMLGGNESIEFKINALWQPLLILSASGGAQASSMPLGCINLGFYDRHDVLLPVNIDDQRILCGDVSYRSESAHSLLVSLDESSECGQFIAQLTPPEDAVRLALGINSRNDSKVKIFLKISTFNRLIYSRLLADSCRVLLENEDTPEQARKSLLEALLKKFPLDPLTLEVALERYYNSGDFVDAKNVAIRILNDVASTSLRYKARLILAEERVLRRAPLRSGGSDFVYKRKVAPGIQTDFNVAVLIGNNILDDSNCDTSSILSERQAGIPFSGWRKFTITPLGFPALGEAGDPWEVQSVDGVNRYYLNCIQPADLASLSKDNLIEFSVLLCTSIFQLERADAIHCIVCVEDYTTVLIALTLARQLKIPLILEYTDEVLSGKLTEPCVKKFDSIVAQQFHCAAEADVIIAKSIGVKRTLLRQHIASEKIFFLSGVSQSDSAAALLDVQNDRRDVYTQAYAYLLDHYASDTREPQA